MPRELDDDEPVAKPTPKRKKRPADAEPESGPWKALGITFGCVLVAFAGVMIFVMSKAPKDGGLVAGDPPGDTGTPVQPGGIPKTPPVVPGPAPQPKPPLDLPPSPDLVPDDWTPPAWSRPEVDISPGRKMTATPTPGVEPVQGVSVNSAYFLDEPRLLLIQGSTSLGGQPVLRFLDVASGKDLPLPKLANPGAYMYSLAASPDQKALFVQTQIGKTLHRFDVDRRVWESAPLECAGGVAVVSADRLLAVQGESGRLRLLKWQGDGKPPVATAEAAAGGLNSSTKLAFDPLTRTAFTATSADGKGKMDLTRYAVGGRELKAIRTCQYTLTSSPGLPISPQRLFVSWRGDRVFTGNRTIDLATGEATERPYQSGTAAVTPTTLYDYNLSFYSIETGNLVSVPWLATNSSFVSASGTACWVLGGTSPSHTLTCYTLGIEGGAGTVPPPVDPPDPKPPAGPPDPKPPVVPTPPAGSVKVAELASLTGPKVTISSFRFSDKHDLLIYAAGVAGATVLDVKTGQPLPLPKLEAPMRLRAIDVAPDQAAAFATDGRNLHRLDLATRKWDVTPLVGTRVLALDGTTAMVQVKQTNPATWAVVKWDGGAAQEVGRMEWQYLYELGYDPAAKALFALHSKVNNTGGAVLERYARTGDEFKSEGSRKHTGVSPRMGLRPLTADGRHFLQGLKAVPTDLKSDAAATFNETVVGSVGGLAVGGSGQLYAVESGKLVGTLPVAADAVSAAAGGRTAWVYSRVAGKFVKFQIGPATK